MTSPVTIVNDQSGARDACGRSVTSGWGTADRGGSWTLSGTLSRYSVGAGVGSVSLGAGAGVGAGLGFGLGQGHRLPYGVTTDKAPTGGRAVRVPRRAHRAGQVRVPRQALLASTGAAMAYITRAAAGAETSCGSAVVSGLTYTAGTKPKVRFHRPGGGRLTDDPSSHSLGAGPE